MHQIRDVLLQSSSKAVKSQHLKKLPSCSGWRFGRLAKTPKNCFTRSFAFLVVNFLALSSSDASESRPVWEAYLKLICNQIGSVGCKIEEGKAGCVSSNENEIFLIDFTKLEKAGISSKFSEKILSKSFQELSFSGEKTSYVFLEGGKVIAFQERPDSLNESFVSATLTETVIISPKNNNQEIILMMNSQFKCYGQK